MEAVDQILADILRVCQPRRIVLFAEKRSMNRSLQSLSLCVIVDEGDARALRPRLHLAVSADVPVALLVYTSAEWDALVQDETSYAAWVARKGQVVYEQKT